MKRTDARGSQRRWIIGFAIVEAVLLAAVVLWRLHHP